MFLRACATAGDHRNGDRVAHRPQHRAGRIRPWCRRRPSSSAGSRRRPSSAPRVAHSMASMPVPRRPPCVVTSQPDGVGSEPSGTVRASTDNTMHCDPNWRDNSASRSGRAIAAVLTDDLVRAGAQQHVDIGHRPHAAADGERDEHLLGGALTTSSMVARPDEDAVTSRKVSSSAPSRVVGGGEFDGIACVAQVLEVDALDHPAVVDVQARNDAYREVRGSIGSPPARRPINTISRISRARRALPASAQREPTVQSLTGQVGDDASGGPHQRDTGRVVPDVVAETDCAHRGFRLRRRPCRCRWRRASASASTSG